MATERQPTGEAISQPQQEIESLLKRKPSGPDFAESTILYVDQCVGAAASKFRAVLEKAFPGEPAIAKKLNEIEEINFRELPKSDFVREGDKRLLQFPNGSRFPLNTLGEAIDNADPGLGIFDYIVSLYPPRSAQESRQKFPWFNNRLMKIAEVGELSLDNPIIKYVAVGYATQAAKAFAAQRAQEFLQKARFFAGVDSLQRVAGYLDGIGRMVAQLRTDQRFIARGLNTMNDIAESSGWDGERTKLLLDIAFIRNKAFDRPEEFRQVLEPLIRLIAAGEWEEAGVHRDFLLKYFSNSFPVWRSRQNRETGAVTFEGFRDLARAVVQHKVIILDEDVPSEYKASFGEIFPKKVERAQKEKDVLILKKSVGISNTVLRELAYKTKEVIRENSFREMFGEYADRVKEIILSSEDSDEGFGQFFGLVLTAKPELQERSEAKAEKAARWLYKRTKGELGKPLSPDDGPPYLLLLPYGRRFLKVEYKNGRQLCSFVSSGIGYDLTGTGEVNFGGVLRKVILEAIGMEQDKEVLVLDQVRECLQSAYEQEKTHNSELQFSLGEYLRALLGTANISDDDPAMRFAKDLDTTPTEAAN